MGRSEREARPQKDPEEAEVTQRWGERRLEPLVTGGDLLTLRQAGMEGRVLKFRISAKDISA